MRNIRGTQSYCYYYKYFSYYYYHYYFCYYHYCDLVPFIVDKTSWMTITDLLFTNCEIFQFSLEVDKGLFSKSGGTFQAEDGFRSMDIL